MTLRRILVGNRQFRVGRVLGVRTLVQTAVWSLVAVAVVLLNLVGELRYVLLGRRRSHTSGSSQYDDAGDGGLFGMVTDFGDIGGFGGDDGGGNDGGNDE